MDSLITSTIYALVARQLGEHERLTPEDLLAATQIHPEDPITPVDKLPQESHLHFTRRGVAWPEECRSARLRACNWFKEIGIDFFEHPTQPNFEIFAREIAEGAIREAAYEAAMAGGGRRITHSGFPDLSRIARERDATAKPPTRVDIYVGVLVNCGAGIGRPAAITARCEFGVVCDQPQVAQGH